VVTPGCMCRSRPKWLIRRGGGAGCRWVAGARRVTKETRGTRAIIREPRKEKRGRTLTTNNEKGERGPGTLLLRREGEGNGREFPRHHREQWGKKKHTAKGGTVAFLRLRTMPASTNREKERKRRWLQKTGENTGREAYFARQREKQLCLLQTRLLLPGVLLKEGRREKIGTEQNLRIGSEGDATAKRAQSLGETKRKKSTPVRVKRVEREKLHSEDNQPAVYLT